MEQTNTGPLRHLAESKDFWALRGTHQFPGKVIITHRARGFYRLIVVVCRGTESTIEVGRNWERAAELFLAWPTNQSVPSIDHSMTPVSPIRSHFFVQSSSRKEVYSNYTLHESPQFLSGLFFSRVYIVSIKMHLKITACGWSREEIAVYRISSRWHFVIDCLYIRVCVTDQAWGHDIRILAKCFSLPVVCVMCEIKNLLYAQSNILFCAWLMVRIAQGNAVK